MPEKGKGRKSPVNVEKTKEKVPAGPGKPQGASTVLAQLWKNELVRLGCILLIITAIAAMLLSLVNEITKAPIEELAQQALMESLSKVYEQADDFEKLDAASEAPVTAVYAAKKSGSTVGYCVRVAPKGFGGEIDMIVGVTRENTVTGVQIISMSETPGLGTRVQEEAFSSQYLGKGLTIKVVKSESPKDDEISAISGATITSKAVTEGINAALKAAQAMQ